MNPILINRSKRRMPRKFIVSWLAQIERELRGRRILKAKGAQELVLVFVSRAEGKKLNRQFRGRDYATDVLSFDSLEPGSLGELVFCTEVLDRQAREHELSFNIELGYMMIHGVLHLLGFDHEKGGREEQRMMRLQDALFESLCARYEAGRF